MKTKTIIITAVPSGRGPLGIAAAPRLLSQAQSPSSQAQQPRKRERLTHLTAEEKLNRRKLKNRIAAQTARDRKKARMANLEETTTDLQADNDALIVENEALRQQNADLAAENARLRAALETGGGSGDSGETLGSAASISAPLQWEQVSTSAPALLSLLATLLSLSSPNSSRTSTQPQLPPQTRAELEEMEASLAKGHSLSQPQLLALRQLSHALWSKGRLKAEP